MPQSLAKVNVHIVFTTKYRVELINDEIRSELHSYLVGTLASLNSYTYELYANPDHVHILCTLPRTMTMANLVSKIKTSTSKWIKTKGIANFYWQDGYGVFSVSSSKINVVRKYISNQPIHHMKKDTKDEFRQFLVANGIEYDERYVWD